MKKSYTKNKYKLTAKDFKDIKEMLVAGISRNRVSAITGWGYSSVVRVDNSHDYEEYEVNIPARQAKATHVLETINVPSPDTIASNLVTLNNNIENLTAAITAFTEAMKDNERVEYENINY